MTMKRRGFLKTIFSGLLVAGLAPEVLAEVARIPPTPAPESCDSHIKDYLYKIRHFDDHHEDDFCLDRKGCGLLKSSVKRLKCLQRTVGHGNFCLIGFDDALKIARNYSRVGRFTRAELEFLEMIFYESASLYGFFGEKPLGNLTERIQRRRVVKIPHTGNYVYKGLPLDTYRKVENVLGSQVVLTSGIRSIIKQFLLFLSKAHKSKGNLSLASRSLAPPGYSFHGIGDFDVGQVGFGVANFTERFTRTRVFRRLADLGYVRLRYEKDNMLGVRFEPWHVKVTENS